MEETSCLPEQMANSCPKGRTKCHSFLKKWAIGAQMGPKWEDQSWVLPEKMGNWCPDGKTNPRSFLESVSKGKDQTSFLPGKCPPGTGSSNTSTHTHTKRDHTYYNTSQYTISTTALRRYSPCLWSLGVLLQTLESTRLVDCPQRSKRPPTSSSEWSYCA